MAALEGGTQVGQPGLHGDGEDALGAVRRQVYAVVALTELGAVVADEEAEVGKGRGGPAKGFVEGEVLGRGDEPFLGGWVSLML